MLPIFYWLPTKKTDHWNLNAHSEIGFKIGKDLQKVEQN